VSGSIVAVCARAGHGVGKDVLPEITLRADHGVVGDAHASATVQHLSRVRKDASQPNLRQVHLMHEALHTRLRAEGFDVGPGTLGENVLTRGVDLLALPTGAALRLGASAIVTLTGLRNPCVQLDALQPGLMKAVLDRDEDGALVRLAGVMGVVTRGGAVRPGDPVEITLPAAPHRRLEPV